MHAKQHVDRLGEVDGRDRGLFGPQQRFDVVRRELVGDERDERVGVENDQARCRRSSARRSSSRAIRRSSSVGRILPRSAPRAAAIGSSGKGLRTT